MEERRGGGRGRRGEEEEEEVEMEMMTMMMSTTSSNSNSNSGGSTDEKMTSNQLGKGRNRKKRFSEEQVKYLESIFESESKLEARKKEEVAVELGMQPRQVSIWFQNKRARWKSKQIEHDYKALRASYDALTSRFESLKNEKQSLLAQLQQLGDLLEKPGQGARGGTSSSDGGGSDAGEAGFHHRSVKCSDGVDKAGGYSDHHDHHQQQLGHHDQILIDGCENGSGNGNGNVVSMETNGKWLGFGSAGFYDQSCNISQLWDFWSSG